MSVIEITHFQINYKVLFSCPFKILLNHFTFEENEDILKEKTEYVSELEVLLKFLEEKKQQGVSGSEVFK